MKLCIIKFSIWLFWVCLHKTKAYKSGEIIIKFHQEPDVAYVHSPVQGVCGTSLGKGSEIHLEVEEMHTSVRGVVLGDYVLKNRYLISTTESDNVVAKIVTLNPYNPFKKAGIGFAICTNKLSRLELFCLAKNAEGVTMESEVQQIIFQSGPRRPRLMIHYHLKPNFLLLSETLNVYCGAHVGANGSLTIEIPETSRSAGRKWTVYADEKLPVDMDKYKPSDPLYFHRNLSSYLGPKIDVLLKLEVTEELSYRHIVCTASNSNITRPMTARGEGNTFVIDFTYRPHLHVNSSIKYNQTLRRNLWHISGYCRLNRLEANKVQMFHKTSVYTYVFTWENSRSNSSNFTNTRVTGPDNSVFHRFWTVNDYPTQLSVHLVSGLALNSAPVTVTCRVKNIQRCQTFSPQVGSDLETEDEEFGRPKPEKALELRLKNHRELDVANIRSPLQGVCGSTLDAHSVLHLEIKQTRPVHHSQVLAAYVLQGNNISTSTESDSVAVKVAPLDYLKANLFQEDGIAFAICMKELSTLTITCRAEDADGNNNGSAVKQISFQNGPRKPHLMIDFHLKPNYLLLSETLNVYCSAYVGTHGRLTIEIHDLPGRKWTAYADEKLAVELDKNKHNGTLHVRRDLSSDLGPRIDALLKLRVTKNLSKRKFVCTASDSNNTRQMTVTGRKAFVKNYPYRPHLEMKNSVKFYRHLRRNLWRISGFCRINRLQADKVQMIHKTSVYTYVFTWENSRSNTRNFTNTNYTGPDNSVFHHFWTVNDSSTELSVHLESALTLNSAPVTVACRVKDIQICQTFSHHVNINLNTVEDSWRPEPQVIDIVTWCVLGLCVGFLVMTSYKLFLKNKKSSPE